MPDVGPSTEQFCGAYEHEYERQDVSATVFTVFCKKCPFLVTMTTELNDQEMADAVECAWRIATADERAER